MFFFSLSRFNVSTLVLIFDQQAFHHPVHGIRDRVTLVTLWFNCCFIPNVYTVRAFLKFQEMSLKQFQEMAVIVKEKSHDRRTLASHIKDTAVIIETGIVNVVMAASFSAGAESRTNDSHLLLNTTREKVIEILCHQAAED